MLVLDFRKLLIILLFFDISTTRLTNYHAEVDEVLNDPDITADNKKVFWNAIANIESAKDIGNYNDITLISHREK